MLWFQRISAGSNNTETVESQKTETVESQQSSDDTSPAMFREGTFWYLSIVLRQNRWSSTPTFSFLKSTPKMPVTTYWNIISISWIFAIVIELLFFPIDYDGNSSCGWGLNFASSYPEGMVRLYISMTCYIDAKQHLTSLLDFKKLHKN